MNWTMIVAARESGHVINMWCKDGETLTESFNRLLESRKLESWDGWRLSAWPALPRHAVNILDGEAVDLGPIASCSNSPTCRERTENGTSALCARCAKGELE